MFFNVFRKLWSYRESQWRIKAKGMKMLKIQNCFSWLPENQPDVYAVNKNNLKQIYLRSGKERILQTDLYWFTLTPRATSSPQKPLGISLCNQPQITNHTHQSRDLEPVKNTHFLWQLQHTTHQNTLWLYETQFFTEIQIKERITNDHTWYRLNYKNYTVIIFHF